MATAIKIDSKKKDIYEIQISEKKQILKEIHARFFDSEAFDENHNLYYDDEGILVEDKIGGFRLKNFIDNELICGNGVIVNIDSSGTISDHAVNIQELKNNITWINPEDLPSAEDLIISSS